VNVEPLKLGYRRSTAISIAELSNRILKQDTVNIVFEPDACGFALQRSYASTARTLGIRIKNVWGIKSESDDVDQVLKTITRALQRDPRPEALFVGLQDHEAAKLVRLIRDIILTVFMRQHSLYATSATLRHSNSTMHSNLIIEKCPHFF
jgi:hypothetical protein